MKPTIEQLVAAYRARLIRDLSRFYQLTEAEREEVAQSTFLNAHEGLGDFRNTSQVYTWLYRIAVRAAIDALRERRREVSTVPLKEETTRAEAALYLGADVDPSDDDADIRTAGLDLARSQRTKEDSSLEQYADANREWFAFAPASSAIPEDSPLARAIEQLPSEQHDAISLFLLDLSDAQIGEQLGITALTARKRRSRAIESLRKIVDVDADKVRTVRRRAIEGRAVADARITAIQL